MNHRTARILTAAFASALIVGLSLSGCSSITTPAPTPTSSRAAKSDGAQIPKQPTGVVAATAVPTDVPNDAKIRDRASIKDCAKTNDGWKAAGVATNPTKKRAEYTITVFFLASTGTVIGSGQATQAVDPGKKGRWSVSDTFTAPKDTRCVLRGVGE